MLWIKMLIACIVIGLTGPIGALLMTVYFVGEWLDKQGI